MSDCYLTRPCDACGKFIGGAYYHCPKCNIYMCFTCALTLTVNGAEYPLKCPMCGEEFI